jgi:hypothetical protein
MAQPQEPEIVVEFDMVSDFWTHGREAWQATVGDYDLDCTVGTGATPLAAIVDLLDQLGG